MNTVSYQSARQHISTGDILLCSGGSEISEIIKRVSAKSYPRAVLQFTHVGIFDWWHGRLMVSEACEGKGVLHSNFSNKYIKNKYDGRLFIAKTKGSIGVTTEFVMSRIADAMSCDYAESDLFKIAANKILGMKFKPDENNSFICSELVNYGYNLLFCKSDKFCIPNDIAYSKNIELVYEII